MRPRIQRGARGLALVMGALLLSGGLVTPGRSFAPSGGLPFPIGERLTYTISWAQYLVAGEMTLAVKARGRFFDRPGVHLELRASTVGPVRALLKSLDEQWTSYVDPETWLPYRVEHARRDGDRRTDLTITLDHRRGIARLSTGRTIPISPQTRDVVAFLYHLRTLPLRPGSRHQFSLLSERRRLLVHADVGSRTSIQTRLGRFEALEIALRVEAVGGKATETSHLRLWLSADERRVPLMITAEERLGEIRVELIEIAAGATVSQESSTGSPAILSSLE
ncbi:MAG: DUF3108 domain-containing protein [Blastocatellia bacterium]|nr:DUF3108 domain-containing protein [Blastocatellia bacterium]